MKRLLFLSLFTLLSMLIKGQSISANALAESQIRFVMKIQEKAWNRGDLKAYMSAYWNSDSLMFIGRNGPTYGWSKTYSNYVNAYPNQERMGKLTFNILKLDIINDTHACVIGKWHLKRSKDEPQGYFSLLWQKKEGEWKIIIDHSSSSQEE